MRTEACSTGVCALNNECCCSLWWSPVWTAGIKIHAAAAGSHSACSLPTDSNWLTDCSPPLFTLQLCLPQNGNNSVTGICSETHRDPCWETVKLHLNCWDPFAINYPRVSKCFRALVFITLQQKRTGGFRRSPWKKKSSRQRDRTINSYKADTNNSLSRNHLKRVGWRSRVFTNDTSSDSWEWQTLRAVVWGVLKEEWRRSGAENGGNPHYC